VLLIGNPGVRGARPTWRPSLGISSCDRGPDHPDRGNKAANWGLLVVLHALLASSHSDLGSNSEFISWPCSALAWPWRWPAGSSAASAVASDLPLLVEAFETGAKYALAVGLQRPRSAS
jgi:hypothetical protein